VPAFLPATLIPVYTTFAVMRFPLQPACFSVQDFSIQFYVPATDAVKAAFHQGQIKFPYWSQVWPAAKALATFLVLYPDYTKGKTVLELGGGLGLPSLVAAQNAATVLCTDYEPEAIEVVSKSAAGLQLKNLETAIFDWNQTPPKEHFDVLLLSDINYEPAAFETLLTLIKTFLENGTLILLSTPQRLAAKDFIAPLLPACTWQQEIAVDQEGTQVMASVMVLQKNLSMDRDKKVSV
jgi:predicted nicotinamide N-methyase